MHLVGIDQRSQEQRLILVDLRMSNKIVPISLFARNDNGICYSICPAGDRGAWNCSGMKHVLVL